MVRRRRVLMVVSSYFPIMLADMQRVRMLTWILPSLGWDCEILTPSNREVKRPDALEPGACDFFPEEIPIHEVGSCAASVLALIGAHAHGWRTFIPMYRMGNTLLASSRFDLVFFSTTMFSYFALGPMWKRRHGIPYVLDYHDPWVRDKSIEQGRGIKTRLKAVVAGRLEQRAVAEAAGVLAVSPMYLEMLRTRYGYSTTLALTGARSRVVPFGALHRDFTQIAGTSSQELQDSITINYVGAGGRIMSRAFSLFCAALAKLRADRIPITERLRVRLYGTMAGWKSGDECALQKVAESFRVDDLICEQPGRVSYRDSLSLTLASDGLLLLGVDDVGYMPSKLASYVLSGKPIVAILHRGGPAYARFVQSPTLGHLMWFDGDGQIDLSRAAQVLNTFLNDIADKRITDRTRMLPEWTAETMARQHVQLFEACVAR